MRSWAFLPLAAIVAACATTPPTSVYQPMTVRPPARLDNVPANGSIYQAGSMRPLFEDRRARYVGDTLTITLSEKTAATVSSNSSANHTGTSTASVGSMIGVLGNTFENMSLDASDTNTFSGKGAAANNNTFTGTITVTVIEVLPNGNLLVSGEKQLAIGQGQEFVRLSGVVNPQFIDTSNSIASSKVADARIEYKSAGYINEAETMGWLARFFLSVMPF
jgi:flagellar L-ring protein FlgH